MNTQSHRQHSVYVNHRLTDVTNNSIANHQHHVGGLVDPTAEQTAVTSITCLQFLLAAQTNKAINAGKQMNRICTAYLKCS